MNRFGRTWLCLVLLVATGVSVAQQPGVPRLLLNPKGPLAQVQSLGFSSDSTRLYAGGLDKMVHVWEVGWNDAPQVDQPIDVTYTGALHWEIARGNRGSIYSLALSPTRNELIVGGVSARQQTGDIAVFDIATQRILSVLPSPQERQNASDQNRIGSEGHHSAVVSVDYSPSGDAVLSRDERGGVFLWRQDRQTWQSEQLRAPDAEARRFPPRGVFVNEQTIVYSFAEQKNRVVLMRRNLRSGREVRFPETYSRRVAALARDRAGEFWASADDRGHVYLTSLKNPQQRHTLTTTLPEITAIAFGGDSLMAVVSNEFVDGRPGRATVDLFDVLSRERIDTVDVSASENTLAVALSPDGRFLATHCEDPRHILLLTA